MLWYDRMFVFIFWLAIINACVGAESCSKTIRDGTISVDCMNQNIQSLPNNTYGNVTYLDISYNSLNNLDAAAFIQYPELRKLNLSSSGIKYMDRMALSGLTNLAELDLRNNPILSQPLLVSEIFKHCTSITHLYTTGGLLPGSLFLPLENLTELTMSPNRDVLPYELVQLPELRVLNDN